MEFIKYKIGCRNCLKSDNIQYNHLVSEIESKQLKTEYEIVPEIEKWRIDNSIMCEFCGSSNVQIEEIEINDILLYHFDRILKKRCFENNEFMFQLKINKNNGELGMSVSGNIGFDPTNSFKIKALEDICKTVKNTPDKKFKSHHVGKMIFCITGGLNKSDNLPYTRIETFRTVGLLKDEIILVIQSLAKNDKISINC